MVGRRDASWQWEGLWSIFMWRGGKAMELSYLNIEEKLRAERHSIWRNQSRPEVGIFKNC